MEETTAPIICDEHHFVEAEVDEITGEEYAGNVYCVTRWFCPVKGCRTITETAEEVR